MENNIFDETLLKYAQVFPILTAPMGDYAPRLRLISVDYKDRNGTDCRQDSAALQNPKTTDEQLVELVRERYTSMGCGVSAISELILEKDRAIGRCLYAKPGFLEESMTAAGLPIPEDMIANSDAAGFHPVNWDELVEDWKQKAAPSAANTEGGRAEQNLTGTDSASDDTRE